MNKNKRNLTILTSCFSTLICCENKSYYKPPTLPIVGGGRVCRHFEMCGKEEKEFFFELYREWKSGERGIIRGRGETKDRV
jgi:hypothetical protein